MENATESSPMAEIAAEWYALNPAVRQLWMYETEGQVNVVVTLAPAGDSDEPSPAWLAHYSGWQRELQSLIGRTVTLDCLGGYAEIVPFGRDARDPRVCLASILWRAL